MSHLNVIFAYSDAPLDALANINVNVILNRFCRDFLNQAPEAICAQSSASKKQNKKSVALEYKRQDSLGQHLMSQPVTLRPTSPQWQHDRGDF